MKIKVENWYEDGHESVLFYEVDESAVTGMDLSDFEDAEDAMRYFFSGYTGDGHGLNNDLAYCHDVTIVEADDPALVGMKFEGYGL